MTEYQQADDKQEKNYQQEKDDRRMWESCINLTNQYIVRLMTRLSRDMPNPTPLSNYINVLECENANNSCEGAGLTYSYTCNMYGVDGKVYGKIHGKHYHLITKKEINLNYLCRYLRYVHDEYVDIYANGSYKDILIPGISLGEQQDIDDKIDIIMSMCV